MAYNPPRKNVEYIFYIGLISQATGQLQANPTIAAGDFKVSTDGGAFGNLGTLPAVTPASGKSVKVTLSNTEMNGDNVVVVGSDAAGSEWNDIIVSIQPSIAYSTDGVISANATISTGTGAGQLDITSGVVKSNMTQIDGQATNGNNATLNLKKLNIVNVAGDGIYAYGSDDALRLGSGGVAAYISGAQGMLIESSATSTPAISIITDDGGNGIDIQNLSGGKAISAPNDIAVSDGDLTIANLQLISAGQITVKKNVALPNFAFVMTDTDGVPLTGLSPAAERRIDSGSFGACANTPATELANGWYTIDLADSDLNGTTIALRFSDTGAADTNFTIVTQD